jgi:hypothetical protein
MYTVRNQKNGYVSVAEMKSKWQISGAEMRKKKHRIDQQRNGCLAKASLPLKRKQYSTLASLRHKILPEIFA